jgi:hypothetical protein
MPKVKCSSSVKLHDFIKEFGDKYFSTDGKILFCKMCEVKVMAYKGFTVQQHCNTVKHKSCVNREITTESRQRLLFENYHPVHLNQEVPPSFQRIFVL